MTQPRVQIKDLKDYLGKTVYLQGWLYNRRGNKNIHFLQLRDGSGFIQGVVEREHIGEELFEAIGNIGNESSLKLQGLVIEDKRSKAGIEVQVKDLEVIQAVQDYPIQISRDVPNIEKLLDNRHLWLRSPKTRAILKIRSEVEQAIRQFYYERDFVFFDAPILTPNAGEGTTSELFETDYFGKPLYLTQTGQLYGEAGCMAFGKVVVFGPTFRAEKSKTRRHLTEFWMVEPEVAFLELDGLMELAEEKLEYLVAWVVEKCATELETLGRDIEKLRMVKRPFPRVSYNQCQELLTLLKQAYSKGKNQAEAEQATIFPLTGEPVRFPADVSNKEIKRMGKDILSQGPGQDLGATDESVLSFQFDKPLMIHRYPADVKAFYMKRDLQDSELSLCVDVIAPEGYGEIIGGSQREEDLDTLLASLEKHNLPKEAFNWFLELRKYGTIPHSGFGLGVERVVQWMCGIHHIREAIPFPRTLNRSTP